jgi:hypothetical protein
MMPDDDRAAVLAAIAAMSWRFAKTMPDTPHEYTRKKDDPERYALLFDAVKRHGVREKWGKAYYRYLYPGDGWKYWAMAGSVEYSQILNRARIYGA